MDVHSNNSEPLFLFDNDSDVEFASEARRKEAQEPAVDDHTGEADASGPVLDAIAPPRASSAFDVEAYQKESLARHRKELNKTRKSVVIFDAAPKSSANVPDVGGTQGQEASGDKKPRQKQIKFDEGLLLSAKGFPQLIKNTKDFKLKGKGHEVRTCFVFTPA
jgi:replication fork protection complex subunit Csm3/Swi3